MILWLLVQLVFWLAVMAAFLLGAAVVILAPPYLAGRYVLRRLRA